LFAFVIVPTMTQPLRGQGAQAKDVVLPSLVEVVAVERDDILSASQFVATVVPTRRSVVGAAVDGRVETFLLDAEDSERKLTRVSKDQVLAQLKTDTVEHELGAARAELLLRQEQLAELRNGARPEEITTARAQLFRAQAALKYASSRHKRLESLFEANSGVSLDQLEESLSSVSQAEQSCAEAQAKYDLIVAGPRVEQIAQAEARVQNQEQTVQLLEEMLRKYTLRAPFDGYVVNEFTEVGAWVMRGDPVAEVIQLVPMEVEASLPEKYIPDVKVGEPAEIRLTVMPDQPLPGRVERIIPQADVRSRTFPIRVRLDESIRPETHRIMAGMLGHVVLSLQDSQAVKLVPKDALVLNGGEQSVVVVDAVDPSQGIDAKGVARVVPVELGVTRQSSIQIRGDVRVGDLVVTRGNERLRSGQYLVWKGTAVPLSPSSPAESGTSSSSLSLH
jgi:RND family efflux transporter MFP subunit